MSAAAVRGTPLVLAAAQAMARCDGLRRRLAKACLRASGVRGRWLAVLAGSSAGRRCLAALEQRLLPGVSAHYRWRKRRIARWSREAVRAGACQVLVLGAGFDALGPTLARPGRAALVVELDREPVMAAKWHALRTLGHDLGPMRLVASDLARGLSGADLATVPGFDPAAPTLVVAEGLLMYLSPRRARGLLHALQRRLRGPVALVATSMAPRADGSPGFARQGRAVDRWLGTAEPFRWALQRDALVAALQGAGLRDVAVADAASARDPDPCPGELVWRAAWGPPAQGRR